MDGINYGKLIDDLKLYLKKRNKEEKAQNWAEFTEASHFMLGVYAHILKWIEEKENEAFRKENPRLYRILKGKKK